MPRDLRTSCGSSRSTTRRRSRLGNLHDRRTNPNDPEVDAAFKPATEDNAERPDVNAYFLSDPDPDCFTAEGSCDTTVRDAVRRAENGRRFAVAVFLRLRLTADRLSRAERPVRGRRRAVAIGLPAHGALNLFHEADLSPPGAPAR